MEGLSPEEILNLMPRRPKVLKRLEDELESEELGHTREVHELSGGKKIVIETRVVQTTTRYVTVREHDPSSSYQDSLDEFIERS